MPNGLPPPYPEIYERVMAGKLIPFLGAGAPRYDRNPQHTPWFQKQQGREVISHLPTAGELVDYFAMRTHLPASERGELTKMAQYYEAVLGPDPLCERLRETFSHPQTSTPLHQFLAGAAASTWTCARRCPSGSGQELPILRGYSDIVESGLEAGREAAGDGKR